ncbi:hypothetical protein SEMRO_25_G016700.1 [Seminavis robusta]|uniref:Uncharacterized protein n=1 Tax=Seminavis robusta TaxID=568900 RepID=A0A9N8H1W6_9STRA|nr:hypothetical protein SEMRO_25_G016700.1 [Seminavis robusta]|eukprot:Sro25_g016700.1 n/a (213) ;mRNA; r:5523-6161
MKSLINADHGHLKAKTVGIRPSKNTLPCTSYIWKQQQLRERADTLEWFPHPQTPLHPTNSTHQEQLSSPHVQDLNNILYAHALSELQPIIDAILLQPTKNVWFYISQKYLTPETSEKHEGAKPQTRGVNTVANHHCTLDMTLPQELSNDPTATTQDPAEGIKEGIQRSRRHQDATLARTRIQPKSSEGHLGTDRQLQGSCRLLDLLEDVNAP